MINPTIQDEFPLIEQEVPGFASLLIEGIEQGSIEGSFYVTDTGDAGCAYGNICQFDSNRASKLCEYILNKLYEGYDYTLSFTPLEKLVNAVDEGETHETNDELAQLRTALLTYQQQLSSHHA